MINRCYAAYRLIYRSLADAVADLDPLLVQTLMGFNITEKFDCYQVEFSFAFWQPTIDDLETGHSDSVEQCPNVVSKLFSNLDPRTEIELLEASVVKQRDASSGGSADAYGRFVDPHVVAVNHDHYFNFRLDLDVDGTENNFVADRLVTKKLPAEHPRRSIWVQQQEQIHKESEAKMNIDLSKPTLWRVISTASKNHVGYPASYHLMPGKNTMTLMTPDDFPRRRAGFLDHHLWVTPHAPDERYAAGEHPTLSEPGEGLPNWTAGDRSLDDTDLVLWHSIGMQHLVRAEDWPVMPTLWHSFELRPFDFFDRNPALDLPVD